VEVEVTETEITYRGEDNKARVLRWADLTSISILTNDQGPFEEDVFWLIAGPEGSILIPQGAEGTLTLLTRAQELPDFDNNAYIAAMGSTENQVFFCWQRAI